MRRPFEGRLLNNIHVMYSFITKNLIKYLERGETEEHFYSRRLSQCRSVEDYMVKTVALGKESQCL